MIDYYVFLQFLRKYSKSSGINKDSFERKVYLCLINENLILEIYAHP